MGWSEKGCRERSGGVPGRIAGPGRIPGSGRRRFLGQSLWLGLWLGLGAAAGRPARVLAGQTGEGLPPDKYHPRGEEVSVKRFRQTVSQERFAWVMYDCRWPSIDKKTQRLSEMFWLALKEEFGDRVDAFIRIDVTAWPHQAKEAKYEVQSDLLPGFVLYNLGLVVKDMSSRSSAVRVNAPSQEAEVGRMIRHLKTYTILKALEPG